MPLPEDAQTPWPPLSEAAAYNKMAEWSAWYGGDPERLRDFYASAPSGTVRAWWRVWSRIGQQPQAQKAQLHVPIAGDLAAVSGALLFGEEPVIRLKDAHVKGATPAAKDAEARLQKVLVRGGAYNRFVEAAETAAAIGGVYLYPAWDTEVADHPFVAIAQADQAVPVFVHGMLRSVVLWREVRVDGTIYIRHLELHEPGGTISHAVYRGTATMLGARMSDESLAGLTGLPPVIELPFKELDVEYVPNMRPNRLWRTSSLGLSDYSGSEGMFDALDEVYISWMRDIRLAKARIIVPREFIDEAGDMDIDHEVYQPMDMEPGAAEAGARSMLAQQFDIRWEEHRETAIELVERIVSNSGYSPQTFGIRIEGRAESGTALRIRESKTILTLGRKANWWRPALERLAEHLLLVDQALFKGPGPVGEVEATMNDGIPTDMVELAQTAAQLSAAQAASIETRVRLINPHWTREEVEAEVERIREENNLGGGQEQPAPDGAPDQGGDQPPDMGMEIVVDPQTGEPSARRARGVAGD